MSPLVQVSELQFVTPEGKKILEDVTLRVNHGELVFLVGPPSSGKSLILRLLYHELRPQRGQILVDDRNVTRLHPRKLFAFRRRLGIVPQELVLPRRTVRDTLAFKLGSLGFSPDDITSMVDEILETVKLRAVADTLISELDLAQQRLWALALAACHSPVLLLVDEPFAGLEYKDAQKVLEGLQSIHERKRVAMLVATRERGWAVRSGARIVYLQAGRTHEAL
ncbi:MAG: ATP-binding cassette domain-containing protein [Candidatus Bipolaricaulota bacterium]|nr:ATP-binding cassette domain-containing protein [Candidatus Bipolaricaulota bacterium]MDW8031422.1 ATP-binding cassette domain-containing protein [Candidatus Bipolaricaulota bacterium]